MEEQRASHHADLEVRAGSLNSRPQAAGIMLVTGDIEMEAPIQLYLRTWEGRCILLTIATRGRMSRVGDLNEAVHNQLGILPERQLIRYAGRLLLAGRRLADYGIEDESWLDLGLRLMGGSASSASGAEAWRGVPDAVGCAVDQRVPMSIDPIAPPSPQAADGQPGRRRGCRRNRSRSRMGAPPQGDEPSQGTQLAADVGRLRIAEARGNSGTQRRHYCPVVGCPQGDPNRAAGWTCAQSLRNHVQEHASGRLACGPPPSWLAENSLDRCSVCSKLLSRRFGGTCPRCRPQQRQGLEESPDEREIPEDWPSLAEVAELDSVLRGRVPKNARKAWAQCLATAMADVNSFNDTRAWVQFFSLPQVVLAKPARGGAKNARRRDREVLDKAQAWLEGRRAAHRRPARQGRKKAGAPEPDRARFDRASAFAREGLYAKACGALVSEPPVKVDGQVWDEMARKHPRENDYEAARRADLRPISAHAAILPDIAVVESAIRSFPFGSAGGCSGLKPQHLKDALVAGMADEVLRQITALVGLLAQGLAHPCARELVCGGRLMALRKVTGDLRPIAIGETIRRLTSKALASLVVPRIREELSPIQVGIGTSCGAEAACRTVRQWKARNHADSSKVLGLLDVQNAFNCVDRSVLRAATRQRVPELAPWCDFCYGADSALRMGSGTPPISSGRGIQQGDPLGPLFLSIAIQGVIEAALAECQLVPSRSGGLYVFPRRRLPGRHGPRGAQDDGVAGTRFVCGRAKPRTGQMCHHPSSRRELSRGRVLRRHPGEQKWQFQAPGCAVRLARLHQRPYCQARGQGGGHPGRIASLG